MPAGVFHKAVQLLYLVDVAGGQRLAVVVVAPHANLPAEVQYKNRTERSGSKKTRERHEYSSVRVCRSMMQVLVACLLDSAYLVDMLAMKRFISTRLKVRKIMK